MPFGLTNAPATFQRLMECVLAVLTPMQCLVYLDDIIIFSSSFQEHLEWLSAVLTKLEEAGLCLRLSKCQFARKQVRYLGHIISSEGVTPDPDKIKAVQDYPIPTTLKELRKFLGLVNYYRRFVKKFASIAEPLYKITRKGIPFKWTSACQGALDTLKQALSSPPILSYPHFDVPFTVFTDASNWAVGAVLAQIKDGEEHVVDTIVDSCPSKSGITPPRKGRHWQ